MHTLIVVLVVSQWAIVLHSFSDIQINVPGWDTKEDLDMILTRSSPARSSIHLRPNDTFQIGRVMLQIQRGSPENLQSVEVQVTSSGYDRNASDNEDEQTDKGFKASQLLSYIGRPHSSTPDTPFGISTTILETPAASRYHDVEPNQTPLMSATAGNLERLNEDIQNEETFISSPVALCQTVQATESRIKKAESIDPEVIIGENDHASLSNRFLSQSRETKDPYGKLGNGTDGSFFVEAIQAKELQNQSLQNPNSQGKVFDDDDIPESLQGNDSEAAPHKISHAITVSEDIQDSILDRRNDTLNLALMDTNRVLSSPIRSQGGLLSIPNMQASIAEAPDAAKLSINFEPSFSHPAIPSASTGRKRKRINDESQDSVNSMVYVAIPTSSTKAKIAKKQSVRKQTPKGENAKSVPNSSEPPSSSRSTRSVLREAAPMATSSISDMRLFFANSTSIDRANKCMTFLEKQGVKKAKSPKECDVLCVGQGDLKKTCNLVLAVILGKQIITDDWVVQSVAKGELLPLNDFLARDPAKEAEWGIDLSEAIERGKQGVKPLLDYSLYFTPAAKKELGKGFADLKDIALHAGAKSVVTLPRKPNLRQAPKTVIIAVQEDADLAVSGGMGLKSYNKDIVALSVLRGSLNADSDEFLIHETNRLQGEASKRQKR